MTDSRTVTLKIAFNMQEEFNFIAVFSVDSNERVDYLCKNLTVKDDRLCMKFLFLIDRKFRGVQLLHYNLIKCNYIIEYEDICIRWAVRGTTQYFFGILI
jgi:hypothetical protein